MVALFLFLKGMMGAFAPFSYLLKKDSPSQLRNFPLQAHETSFCP
jgi:hypothetical protein